jgi:hypothetical protein
MRNIPIKEIKRGKIMVLHTIVSEYDVMCNQAENCVSKFKSVGGGIVEYSETEQGNRILRLFSTDPYMYLDEKYSPFSQIN